MNSDSYPEFLSCCHYLERALKVVFEYDSCRKNSRSLYGSSKIRYITLNADLLPKVKPLVRDCIPGGVGEKSLTLFSTQFDMLFQVKPKFNLRSCLIKVSLVNSLRGYMIPVSYLITGFLTIHNEN